ncbi:MAG: hypothetical protein Q9170_004863 [Blastenia crenularia]
MAISNRTKKTRLVIEKTTMALSTLPPEILDLILQQILSRQDLSSISKTCKTLKGHVFPRLYSHLVLKVPQSWDRLDFLEVLINSPELAEGLQYTSSISIVPQLSENADPHMLDMVSGGAMENLCGDISFPHPLASAHLNTLIRVLLGRIPAQSLIKFRVSHPNVEEYVDDFIQCLEDYDEDDYDKQLTALKDVELIGLNASKLVIAHLFFLDLNSLTSLNLQSCSGLEGALTTLAAVKDQKGRFSGLQLRSFSIRHESRNVQIKTQILDFLVSFEGLTHLSVLLEISEPNRPPDLVSVLAKHGKSLTSLVWDERPGKRESFAISTQEYTLPGLGTLSTIAALCPDLVQLGISIDWRELNSADFWGEYVYSLGRMHLPFQPLGKLQTLNIRNMPLVNPKRMPLPLEEVHSAFANTLLKTLVCPNDRSDGLWEVDHCALHGVKTIAIGALTYRDLRNGLGCESSLNLQLYEFLRLQIYRIDTGYRFEGQPKPLAILTESGTYERTEAAGGDVDIFKPYWLG